MKQKQIATTKTALAKKLNISRSTLYYKPKKPPCDLEDKVKILAVMEQHPAYGHRRIATALLVNHKKTGRLMRKFGLKPKLRRGCRPTKPDDANRQETQVPNILKVLCPLQSNIVWAGDFTYLWFQDRFWYVATVIDVFTREIVGWHIANHHTTALIMEAYQDALRRTGTSAKYFHSDQGSEYVSGAYESLLTYHGTIPSHSRKSSPWQNGFQESFYNNFKLELGNVNRFDHVGQLIEAIHRQILYYNTLRIHSALAMPPVMYRESQQQKMTAVAVAFQPVLLIT